MTENPVLKPVDPDGDDDDNEFESDAQAQAPVKGAVRSPAEVNAEVLVGIDLSNPDVRDLFRQLGKNELVSPKRRARNHILKVANENLRSNRTLRSKHINEAAAICRQRKLVAAEILVLAGFNAS